MSPIQLGVLKEHLTRVMKNTFDLKERAFADELAQYENEWVAIHRDGKVEKIVASGKTLIDAKREAESRGFKNPVYRKVPSSQTIFIA